MNKVLKTIIAVVVPFGTLLLLIHFAIKKTLSNIVIENDVKNIDFTKLLQGKLTSDLDLQITNKNPFSIKVKQFEIKIYKKGELFAESIKPTEMLLEKGFKKEFVVPMNVMLPSVIIGMSKAEVEKDGTTDFSYVATYRVMGIKQETKEKIKL